MTNVLFCLSAGNAKSRVLADPGFFFFSARIAYQIVYLVCRNEPFDQLVEIKNGIS